MRWIRFLRSLFAAAGIAIFLVTVTPFTLWYATLLAGPWHDPKGDTLIVLSSDGGPGPLLGEFSYWRTVYAAWAWQEGGFRRIVLSGDPAGCQPMHAYLRFAGVPASAITLETGSTSTRDNAVHTAALLAAVPGTKVLLSSDYHMFRATRVFRKAGLDVLPRPIPDAGKRAQRWTARPSVFFDLALETAKIAWYAARGWI